MKRKITFFIILAIFISIFPVVLASPEIDQTKKDELLNLLREKEIEPDSFYYFNNPWIDVNQVHNWGSGEFWPYGTPHVLSSGQRVSVYLIWTYGANFRIGFTDDDTGNRQCMTIPAYNDYTNLYAPYDGTFWIRIDNTYGGPSFTYDGWYIVY